MFDVWPLLAILGRAGILLGAWYLLSLLKSVFFGPLKEPSHDEHDHDGHASIGDLDGREIATLAPIMALCLFLGLYPQPMIDVSKQDIGVVADILKRAEARHSTAVAQMPEAIPPVAHP